MGTLPHLTPSHLVDRGPPTAMCPPLGSVIFDSLPSCTSCRPSLGNATEQTIAFLFLLLAANLDSVSQANFQS